MPWARSSVAGRWVLAGPEEDLRLAGIRSTARGENIALAATPDGVHEAIAASDQHRAELLRVDYRRVGVGVVEGPYGLVAVEVFTG